MNWKDVINSTIRVGSKVQLIEVEKHSDWRRHEGDTGTVDKILESNPSLPTYLIHITWSNGDTSTSPENNLRIMG